MSSRHYEQPATRLKLSEPPTKLFLREPPSINSTYWWRKNEDIICTLQEISFRWSVIEIMKSKCPPWLWHVGYNLIWLMHMIINLAVDWLKEKCSNVFDAKNLYVYFWADMRFNLFRKVCLSAADNWISQRMVYFIGGRRFYTDVWTSQTLPSRSRHLTQSERRLFSATECIVSNLRTRLLPERVKALVFLCTNMYHYITFIITSIQDNNSHFRSLRVAYHKLK